MRIGTLAVAAVTALVFGAGSAAAQDRAAIWTGAYAGLHVGGGFGNLKGDQIDMSVDPKGVVGGGYIGYNYQTGGFVLGVEADLGAAAMKWTMVDGADTVKLSTSFLGSLRARVGVSTGPALFYGTLGLGFTNLKLAVTDGVDAFSVSDTGTGVVVGGGMDYRLAGNWVARVEGLHYRFKADGIATDGRYIVNNVRAGLAYKF